MTTERAEKTKKDGAVIVTETNLAVGLAKILSEEEITISISEETAKKIATALLQKEDELEIVPAEINDSLDIKGFSVIFSIAYN